MFGTVDLDMPQPLLLPVEVTKRSCDALRIESHVVCIGSAPAYALLRWSVRDMEPGLVYYAHRLDRWVLYIFDPAGMFKNPLRLRDDVLDHDQMVRHLDSFKTILY